MRHGRSDGARNEREFRTPSRRRSPRASRRTFPHTGRMMDVEIKMPKLGLTMEVGAVTRWLKQPGDRVREGEPLLEIETEKSQCEVESPATGRLTEVRAQVNDEVEV